MSKQITFSYNGKDYALEFTRRTIRQMEDRGFNIQEVSEKPMTLLPDFFAGSFLANHKNVKRELIDEIYENMPNKDKLIEKLVEMYNEPIAALMDEPEENSAKKVNWEASF